METSRFGYKSCILAQKLVKRYGVDAVLMAQKKRKNADLMAAIIAILTNFGPRSHNVALKIGYQSLKSFSACIELICVALNS